MAEPGIDVSERRQRRQCGDENFDREDAFAWVDESFFCGAWGVMLERENRDPMIEFLLDEHTKLHNQFCPDLIFYFNNTHTLLSLMCSHPLHPFPQCFRWIVLIANLAFSFCASAVASYLGHLNNPWSEPVNWVIGPIITNILTEILVAFVKCDFVQRVGTRRIYRWCGTFVGRLLFFACWIVLVPAGVIAGLSFSSFQSQDALDKIGNEALAGNDTDVNAADFDRIALSEFRPSWQIAWEWFIQTLIEWASEFLLLLAFFCYTRYYGSEKEVETGLLESRQEWLRQNLAREGEPLLKKPAAEQAADIEKQGKEAPSGTKDTKGLVDPATLTQ